MGMGLTDDDLLPTELLLFKKCANLWVKPSKHGLSQFAFNKYLGDNEALGGRAYLTNYRILFKSHGFNRLGGMHSLFLPNVVRIRRGGFAITVESRVQTFEFVMWFNGGFVDAAEFRRSEMDREEVKQLRQLVQAHPERIGALQTYVALEEFNKVLSGVMKVGDVIGKLSSPDQSGFAELLMLFSDNE